MEQLAKILLLLSVLLFATSSRASTDGHSFELGATHSLTFHYGERAIRSRGPRADQLRCEGKHCSHVSVPDSVVCDNTWERDAFNMPVWQCTAQMEGGYVFDKLDISCEAMPNSRTMFLRDSCRLVYTLRHPDPLVENHNDGGWSDWRTEATQIVWVAGPIACVLILAYVRVAANRREKSKEK